ncbi:MAG: YicC family protein [Clostridia bacterium]|nr:YicC family protein [Clostridia bacterium]
MIISMTGFGRGKATVGGTEFTIEIKSVNSRFTDITCKMPKMYLRVEDKIKQNILSFATRGKIELFMTTEQSDDAADVEIAIDAPFVRGYLACLHELSEKYGLRNDISVMSVARNPDVFKKVRSDDETADELFEKLSPALTLALEEFFKMKCDEGARLCADVHKKLDYIEQLVEKIKESVPATVEAYRARLTEKISEFLDKVDIDETRIIQEVAIFSDKVAIDEEMVRLGSHIAEFRSILAENDKPTAVPVGRKLDFLLQEINREINTTGSKCNNADVAKIVVEAKSEVEKIREQIQNLE